MPEAPVKSVADARSDVERSRLQQRRGRPTDFQNGDGKNQCTVASVDPGAGTPPSKDTAVTLKLYGDKDGKAPKGCK